MAALDDICLNVVKANLSHNCMDQSAVEQALQNVD